MLLHADEIIITQLFSATRWIFFHLKLYSTVLFYMVMLCVLSQPELRETLFIFFCVYSNPRNFPFNLAFPLREKQDQRVTFSIWLH